MKSFFFTALFLSMLVLTACNIFARPAPPSATLPDDILAIYHKSGGIMGIDDTLRVGQGGLLELTTRDAVNKTLKVDEAMLVPLRNALQNDFGKFDPLHQTAGNDQFIYQITARDAQGNPKTVTTMDGAKHPQELGLIISMLDQLRAQVK
ncbi:MAG: hypothetical protein HY741_29875 [Chloroflexi bacterium]|nr:hypothetical protein [Chloroflexota bacterium]